VVCLAPRALKESVRPRRLAGASARPLNFTVSWRREAQPGCLTPVYTCAYTPLCGWV
jgi:hypothetical protein